MSGGPIVLDSGIEETFAQAPELVLFNPYLAEVHADPYPLYDRLRADDPVHRTEFGAWLVTRYGDCVNILRDPRFSVDPRNRHRPDGFDPMDLAAGAGGPAIDERGMSSVMLFVDPPDHTRLRTLVNKAFTPRVVESLRPRIQELVDQLVDTMAESGTGDVIADLAYPLPVMVISELLGIPFEDRDRIKKWSTAIAPILDPMIAPGVAQQIGEADLALTEYFIDLIQRRKREPRDDLLGRLIRAEEEGESLTVEELLATCILLLIAGHETTMNLIGNGLYALLRQRDQWELLCRDPSLIKTAVEECLRFDGPVHLTGRTALEDIEVGDALIPRGQICVTMLGAANRDPEHFPDPARLDVSRWPNKHIAFSAGPHFCLGATLARAEAQVAFETLTRRLPDLEIGSEPVYRETITLRGLSSLTVSF